MRLTRKERVRRVLLHETVDRLPTQISFTTDMGKIMAVYFNVGTEELPRFLGNHMMRVDLCYPARLSRDATIRYDWWGAGYLTGEEGYYVVDSPLAGLKNLDAYGWPDPYAPGLLDDAIRAIGLHGEEYFIIPNFGFALFERAWSLRGFEQFFMDMALDVGFAEALLDQITDIQLALIQRFLDAGVDGGYLGDDYGAQHGLLVSPRLWRKLIKPRLARLFAPFRERNLPVLMHSDGDILSILPDLVEIGLTTINPVQPEVVDHHKLCQEYCGKLSFYGGISTQTVLPNGTPSGVQAAVRDCVRNLAPGGTGLVIAPSHRMMTDIPPANVAAMLDVFESL